jgi:hypothetical protein
MVRWKLKSCPRCRGDVFLDRDQYGWYEQCLQCSYRRDLEVIVEVREKISQGSLGQAGESAQVRK